MPDKSRENRVVKSPSAPHSASNERLSAKSCPSQRSRVSHPRGLMLGHALGHAPGILARCTDVRVSTCDGQIHNSMLSLNQNNAYVISTICLPIETNVWEENAENVRPINIGIIA